jgi:hypothetical protein
VINDLLDHGDFSVIEQFGLTHIDVSNHGLRIEANASEVKLVTDVPYVDAENSGEERPVIIHWGRSRRHRLGPIELSVATKLKNLASILAVRPGLAGVRSVDVRFDPPHWR